MAVIHEMVAAQEPFDRVSVGFPGVVRYGVINANGVEIVLTLGTGFGSGLYVNGHLVPNLELGHHPLRKDKTYEELIGDAELEPHRRR